MGRAGRIAAWVAAILIGVPVLVVAIVFVGANTDPGRRLLAATIGEVTGGKVTVSGLGGRFPDRLTATRIELHDPKGVWLTIDGARVLWSPLRLAQGQAYFEKVFAARVAVVRLPVGSGGSSSLPVQVICEDIRIDRLELGPKVAGTSAVVGVGGSLRLLTMTTGSAALAIDRLDKPGSYRLDGRIGPNAIDARLTVAEPARGLVAGIAGLPDLGQLSIAASMEGPRTAERTSLTLGAGPLHAAGKGTIDLADETLDLDVTANAPAMSPRSDLSWQSVTLAAHVRGPLTRPDATGHLAIAALAAGGASVALTRADIAGSAGKVDVTASLAGVRLPGPHPDFLGSAPVQIHAEAILDQPSRPVTFTLSHPLIVVAGQANTAGTIAGSATVTIPQLAPFAVIGGLDLAGRAAVTAHASLGGGTTTVALDGTVGLTGGLPVAVGLLGDNAKLSLAGSLRGSDLTLDRATVDGKAIRLSAEGSDKAGVLDLGWKVALSDLSRLAPKLSGDLAADGRILGPQRNFGLRVNATGNLGVSGQRAGKVSVALDAQGLPGAPAGRITANGQFAGSPVQLDASAARAKDGALAVTIARAAWKSATATGKLTLPAGATLPLGRLELRMTRLADLAPLTGAAIAGSLSARLDTVSSGGKPQARIALDGRSIGFGANSIGRVTLAGTIDTPTTRPVASLRLALAGIGNGGTAELAINGTSDALALRVSSDLRLPKGEARIAASAVVNGKERQMRVASLQAAYDGETARLLAPARILLDNGIALQGVRLGIGSAVLTANGRVSPTLALTLSARNLTPALAKPFVPGLAASGTVSFDARLTGALAAPDGSVRVSGRGLRMLSGPGASVPVASLEASATLARGAARLDASVTAGKDIRLRVDGTAPLQEAGRLDLRATGTLDLALADAFLAAEGRTVKGALTLDAAIAGTPAQPRVTGTARLANGGFQDFVQGIHLTDISGLLSADGQTVRVGRLTAKAGTGTLAVGGTIGLAGTMPVALTVTAKDARLFASDRLTTDIDAQLTARGSATGRLDLGGLVTVHSAEINIPDKFPQSVAVLHVIRPGQKPPPPARPGPTVGLAVRVVAPARIFVRGHGLDAELGGRLTVGGTSTAPQIGGGFTLVRGNFSIAGTTLKFTSGTVTFNGAGLTDKIDPAIDFVATSIANGVTATLAVTGYADAPKITLSSVPELPQDEVLAQLLFGQSVKQLSPFQIAEIGQALASLTGVGGGGLDPLGAVRKGLGLDRLSVGGASGNTSGTTVEAGKYVANGVYVGTKQGTSGGTQAQVQVDLTKHLKLETTVGTGGGTPVTGATLDNDPGSSIGLTYQLNY